MSKSIWHTHNERPKQSKYYLEEYEKFSDEIGYLINKQYGNINTIDDLTTKRWCYLDDLLALETENKDLSDKIGKLKSKLDIAVGLVEEMAAFYNSLNMSAPDTTVNWDVVAKLWADKNYKILEQIKDNDKDVK